MSGDYAIKDTHLEQFGSANGEDLRIFCQSDESDGDVTCQSQMFFSSENAMTYIVETPASRAEVIVSAFDKEKQRVSNINKMEGSNMNQLTTLSANDKRKKYHHGCIVVIRIVRRLGV